MQRRKYIITAFLAANPAHNYAVGFGKASQFTHSPLCLQGGSSGPIKLLGLAPGSHSDHNLGRAASRIHIAPYQTVASRAVRHDSQALREMLPCRGASFSLPTSQQSFSSHRPLPIGAQQACGRISRHSEWSKCAASGPAGPSRTQEDAATENSAALTARQSPNPDRLRVCLSTSYHPAYLARSLACTTSTQGNLPAD